MSDECAYCGGRGAGCHPAGVRPDSPAPLSPAQELATNRARIGSKSVVPISPIALDFEAVAHLAPTLDEVLAYKDKKEAWREYDEALNAQLRAIVARVAQEEREKCEGRIKEAEEESARRWGAVLRLQGERDDLRKLLRRVEAVAWFAVKFFNGGRIEIGRRQLAEFEPSNATLETYNAPEDGRFIITATGGTP